VSDAASGDAAHWEELQRLFAQFEQIPEPERGPALEAACPDPQLRRRVLDLLGATKAMEALPSAKPLPYALIGPYRLIREIGAGGIGAVYLAERLVDGVTLRSAVKILAPHAVDPSFVERFYREQQHLAALDHPNITRLLDAGWSDTQQPYLVMEYVDGIHLDEYCDSRELGVDARLKIFLQICGAVSNAHRNLIVHLDLKPSNVLITATGTVKLLDFGTSKLIQIDDGATSTVMATPAYASPEQLLNEPVSTASDVYGLGSVLFELLTGQAPFGRISATARIEAAVREVDPESITRAVTEAAAKHRGVTASRLRQVLHGDLAAIVAACLRPQPRARYSSVEALADEIKRYLNCQPVLARGHTLTYTMGKFIRRHRVPVAVTCSVALAVGMSLGFAWSQQARALREAERAVRMQSFMSRLFKMANPDYTGKPIATVPEFLRVGLRNLPEYIHEPADLRQAELGLAESMFESGDFNDARVAFADLVATAGRANALADKAEAEAYAGSIEFQQGNSAAGRALEADALKLTRGPGIPPRVSALAEIYYAFNEENSGFKNDENLRLLRLAVKESNGQHLTHEGSLALSSLAAVLYMRGEIRDAKSIYEQLLPIYAADPLALCDLSDTYGWLAWISNASGDIAASLPLFRMAYEGFARCSGPDSRMALDQLPYWADALVRLGRGREAVSMLEDALPTWRRASGDNPDHTQAAFLHFLAFSYVAVGRYADAERMATEYLARVDGQLTPNARMIGFGHLVLGQALAGQHRYREALPHTKIAVDLLVKSAVSSYSRELGSQATQLAQRVDMALALQKPSL
jgi:eukaryotic-like serine/threonine-protein kinase